MDGMALAALAFAVGALLGGGGMYVFFAAGRRKRDLGGVTAELEKVSANLRKMDRNFRLFLDDCKMSGTQAKEGMDRAAAAMDSVASDLHAKLSVQSDKLESVDGAVQGLARMVPERFDVLDAAHKNLGMDVGRILDRVKGSVQ